MLDELARQHAGRIDASTTGKQALENSALAATLMREWNPIGSSPEDVRRLFGEPTSESAGLLEYRFDGGLDGDIWRFGYEGDRITRVEWIPLE